MGQLSFLKLPAWDDGGVEPNPGVLAERRLCEKCSDEVIQFFQITKWIAPVDPRHSEIHKRS